MGPHGGLTDAYIEARTRTIGLASMIADAAPKKRGRTVGCAEIPWPLIEDLRDALADMEANR